jgi:hypothetical protein
VVRRAAPVTVITIAVDLEHGLGSDGKPGLGVPHGGGAVAVGMILAQDLADNAGRLPVRVVMGQSQVVHGVQDAPLYRLGPIPHVR